MKQVKLRKDSLCAQCWKTISAGTTIIRAMRVGDMHIECERMLTERQTKEMADYQRRKERGELKWV